MSDKLVPPVNPDPARYRRRLRFAFPPELVQDLGIIESWWEPFEEKTAVSLDDMDGYRPLQMVFGLPRISPGSELNDDWYEKLMCALRQLVESFGDRFFGIRSEDVAPSHTANSPWGIPLPDAFVLYASDVATTDEHDGGWDALLLEPLQRASLIQGVLAKVLDEHVFADLLFGGTVSQKELLSHLDSSMLDSDGYIRKLKRCEEVQRFLGEDTLTANFWAEVERVTAETAQMLMSIINLQRQILKEPLGRARARLDGLDNATQAPAQAPLGICAFYQQLFDTVAVAGYASLHMARSVSIFQINFPEVGQLWDVDQHRPDDDPVYQSSATKARADDTRKMLTGAYAYNETGSQAPPARVDKVKIVTWPRIVRCKPAWNHARDRVRSATRTFITKSHSLYYCGEAGEDGEDEPDEHLGKGNADTGASPEVLELYEHIQKTKAAQRKARQRKTGATLIRVVRVVRWVVNLYLLYLLLYLLYTCLRAWHGVGWRLEEEAAQRTPTEHAQFLIEFLIGAGVSAYRLVVDAARAAPGHVVLVADQLVADVVKPALAKLPLPALGVMRRQT